MHIGETPRWKVGSEDGKWLLEWDGGHAAQEGGGHGPGTIQHHKGEVWGSQLIFSASWYCIFFFVLTITWVPNASCQGGSLRLLPSPRCRFLDSPDAGTWHFGWSLGHGQVSVLVWYGFSFSFFFFFYKNIKESNIYKCLCRPFDALTWLGLILGVPIVLSVFLATNVLFGK